MRMPNIIKGRRGKWRGRREEREGKGVKEGRSSARNVA